MSLVSTIKHWFGVKRSKPVPNTGVRLNGLVEIDTTPFLVHDDYIVFVDPGTNHHIDGIGSLTIHHHTFTRCYILGDNGESMLQQSDEEYILFRQINEILPQSNKDWRHWKTNVLGGDHYTLENHDDPDQSVTYDAVWDRSEQYDEFIEEKSGNKYTCPTHAKLFERQISNAGQTLTEYLLVQIEEEERVSLYAGIELNKAGVTFI